MLTSRFNKAVDQKLITIGIVTAPYISDKDTYITSYMAASYVKWMESAGALVIPLQFDLPKPVLLGLLKQLNGIVLIGGGINNAQTHKHEQFMVYQETMQYILNYVNSQNNVGNYYPIWCICMSFELAAIFKATGNILKKQKNVGYHLIKDGKYGDGTIQWSNSPSKIKNIFTRKEIQEMNKAATVYYAHSYAIKHDSHLASELQKLAHITATSKSEEDVRYVAMFEMKNQPIYGVQFHPEKVPFEYVNDGLRIPKTDIAIKFSTKLARFFINECKKNSNIWIGGKRLFDFTINDYNIFNKATTKRLRNLEKDNIHTSQMGDAGTYLFGPTVVPINSNIIANPWDAVNEN